MVAYSPVQPIQTKKRITFPLFEKEFELEPLKNKILKSNISKNSKQNKKKD